ncbi:MAG: shikimate dehydrogenase [Gemmataceae bacterium]|nr:shikimate dehydrogenase [Gemmataceae bacterium]
MRDIRKIRQGLCGVIAENSLGLVLEKIHEAAKWGASLVEVRADFLQATVGLETILANSPLPTIATARRKADGGMWKSSEEDRIQLLISLGKSSASAIDVEADIFQQIPRDLPCARIVSFHDFSHTPGELKNLHCSLEELNPDFVKIACMANSFADNGRMLDLYALAKIPLLGFCLGGRGFSTRLLALKMGSPWLYSTSPKAVINAPGIPSLEELAQIYGPRGPAVSGKIFGVVGDPISHSMSPLIHNCGFRDLGIDACYLPFQVGRDEFANALAVLEKIPVMGYSVTIPHKENAARLAATSSPLVKKLGSANTLLRREKGFHAENTDAIAIVRSLETQGGGSVGGRKVLVLGAGGVGRAAVFSLKEAGYQVILANRSEEKAARLAKEAGVQTLPWQDRAGFKEGILVNCTSLGMKPDLESTAWEKAWFTKKHLAFDAVYNPVQTRFLREAGEAGVPAITGVEMFVQQAGIQFKLFTGQDPPLEMMRQVVLEKLQTGG